MTFFERQLHNVAAFFYFYKKGMNNLRAIFLLLGLIMVGLNVVLFIAEISPPGMVLVSPIALIGASVYYSFAERNTPSKKILREREIRLQEIRNTWKAIPVSADECEIKSRVDVKGIGRNNDSAASFGLLSSTQPYAIWELAKHDDGRAPGTEMVSQSVLTVKNEVNGQPTTLVSHFIPKDPTSLLFLLHEYKGFNIYINPEDPSQFLFDVFLD